MTIKIVTVVFNDGKELFSDFSTTSDYAGAELFLTPELSTRAPIQSEVRFVDIHVEGYDSWPGISNGCNLIAPLTPFNERFRDEVEGVEDNGLVHLRGLHYCGSAFCGHEFDSPLELTKYTFSRALAFDTQLKNRIFLEGSLIALARDGRICKSCIQSNDAIQIWNS